jgi:hypothetical protein
MRRAVQLLGILLIIIAGLDAAKSSELSPQGRLRKLSLSLRGTIPSKDEFEQVTKLNDAKSLESFFQQKTAEYSASEAFVRKFSDRVLEDLRINTTERGFEGRFTEILVYNDYSANWAPLYHLLKDGKTWNEILASQEFGLLRLISEGHTLINQPTVGEKINEAMKRYGVNKNQALRILMGVVARPIDELSPSQKKELDNAIALIGAKDAAAVIPVKRVLNTNPKLAIRLVINAVRRLGLEKQVSISGLETLLNNSPKNEGMYFTNVLLDGDPDLIEKMLGAPNDDQWKMLRAKAEELMRQTPPKELQSLILLNAQNFRARYNQTVYSQAAAFYRLYLCDEMKPAVPVGEDLTKEALRGLDLFGTAPKDIKTTVATMEKAHASQAQCITCHKKLDPAKKIIDGENNGKPITLIFEDDSGKETKLPILSIDALIPTIQKQEQYKSCQVKKFWNWIIGDNVALSKVRLEELKKIYVNANSSIPALISELANSKEFYSDDHFKKPATVANVRHIFSRCNRCHSNEKDIPSFTELPMKGVDVMGNELADGHFKWVRHIAKATKLMTFGQNAKMPPKGWTLTREDFENIGQWIFDLARDDHGNPTISEKERNEILGDSGLKDFDSQKLAALKTIPAFGKKWARYLEFDSLIALLKELFPNKVSSNYYFGYISKYQALGGANYLTGQPVSNVPTQAYMQILNEYIPRDLTDGELLRFGLGDNAISRFAKGTPNERIKMMNQLMDVLYGPDPSQKFKREQIARETIRAIHEVGSYTRELSMAVYLLIARDEFLTF